MHPLCVSQLVLKILNNNKNVFKFILNGLENGAITKSKQKEIWTFFKDYINELPTSLSQTKNTIKNEFNFYIDTLGRHSFYPYGTKKSKKILIDLDDTVYSVYLAEINFYAWLTNKNLHSYVLEEIINNEKIVYTPKKKKKKK